MSKCNLNILGLVTNGDKDILDIYGNDFGSVSQHFKRYKNFFSLGAIQKIRDTLRWGGGVATVSPNTNILGAVHKRCPHFPDFFDPLPPSVTFYHTYNYPLEKDIPNPFTPPAPLLIFLNSNLLSNKKA